jgi:hypothetical protein
MLYAATNKVKKYFWKHRHSKIVFLLLLILSIPAVEKKKVKIWSALTQIVKVRRSQCCQTTPYRLSAMAGVLDEPYSQLIPLSGVAVQAHSLQRLEQCPSYVAWRAGMPTPLSWLS